MYLQSERRVHDTSTAWQRHPPSDSLTKRRSFTLILYIVQASIHELHNSQGTYSYNLIFRFRPLHDVCLKATSTTLPVRQGGRSRRSPATT